MIHGQLGWCPNHPVVSHTGHIRGGRSTALFLAACLLFLPLTGIIFATGSLHGDAVWIFSRDSSGSTHFEKRVVAPAYALGVFAAGSDTARTTALPGGRYFMVIQHPEPDGSFAVDLDGTWVANRQVSPPGMTGGSRLFPLYGPGSLPGDDAYEALVESINHPPVYTVDGA